eukprot:5446663-Prymnesium_polylepis.1
MNRLPAQHHVAPREASSVPWERRGHTFCIKKHSQHGALVRRAGGGARPPPGFPVQQRQYQRERTGTAGACRPGGHCVIAIVAR